jgi:hypothetical protein
MTKHKRSYEHRALPQLRCLDGYDDPDQVLGSWDFDPAPRLPLCDHWRVPVHVAEDVVVHASAYCDHPRSYRWSWPEIGIYFSDVWAGEVGLASCSWAGPVIGPRGEIAVLPWPDGGAPLVPEEAERVLGYGLKAARAGRFVELGCHAGHGRTGTALAAVMIMSGCTLKTALNNVWDHYCELAIETRTQELYLEALAERVGRHEHA